MLVIGLTGGIGSGKSTAANYFSDLGITIIDADEIARELISHQIVAEKIIKRFGTVERARLREIIFINPVEREWLEQLLHPLIATEIQRRIQTVTSPYCVLVIPLLLEKGKHIKVNRILVVDASRKLQAQRVQQRDHLTFEQFNAIAETQLNSNARRQHADDVIENNGTLVELKQQVEKLHKQYLNIVGA